MIDFQGKSFANFQLSSLLGEGTFARVYRGKDVQTGQEVAVKIFKSFAPDQAALDELRREADICKSLNHPHIVRVYRFDVENGYPYIVMDYLPLSWRQKYPSGARLPLALALKYLKQLGGALQHAHDTRVIHRDLKPGNLLLDKNDQIFLTDFSIARVLNSSGYHNTQNISGTLSYMAPEAFEGKKLGRATDQYSLGVVIYEWLTGRVPFKGDYMQLRNLHVSPSLPPSMHAAVPSLPEAVEKIILQTLAKEPSKRFQSVDAFVRSLEQAGNLSPQPARHLLPPPPPFAGVQAGPVMPAIPVSSPTPELPAGPPASGQVNLPLPQKIIQPSAALPFLYRRPEPAGPVPPAGSSGQQTAGWGTSGTSGFFSTFPDALPGDTGSYVPAPDPVSGQGPTIPVKNPPVGPALHGSPANRLAGGFGANAPTVAGHSLPHSGQTITAVPPVPPRKTVKGATLCIYHEHANPVKDLFWLPPYGEQILSVDSQTAHTWEVQVGSPIASFPLMGQNGVWSPNRAYMAYPASDGIHIYYMLGLAPTKFLATPYRGHTGEIKAIAWMFGSTYLASAGMDKKVHVWAAATGAPLKDIYGGPYQGIYGVQVRPVTHLAASSDGLWIASAEEGGKIQVWNPRDGRTLTSYSEHEQLLRQQGTISLLQWSPDCKRIASQAGREIRVWEIKTGKTLTIHETAAIDFPIFWSPDGSLIASRGMHRSSIEIWFAASRKRLLICDSEAPISVLAWSPDGKMVAAGAGKRVDVWDAQSGRCLYSYTNHTSMVTSIAWSPNGKRIASADAGGGHLGGPLIHIWHAEGIAPPYVRRLWDRTFALFHKNPHTR